MIAKFKIKSIISDWQYFPDVEYETVDVALNALLDLCKKYEVDICPLYHRKTALKVILEGDRANIKKVQNEFIVQNGDEFTFNEVWL